MKPPFLTWPACSLKKIVVPSPKNRISSLSLTKKGFERCETYQCLFHSYECKKWMRGSFR
jgi:hypothetical protein